MSNTADEIDISKRLATVESTIAGLREMDLLTVKMIGKLVFAMQVRTAVKFLGAEEIKSFEEWRDRKLAAARKELDDAQTVEASFEVIYKFDKELVEFVRAAKVDTADKAMEIAHSFIKKYSPVALPLKAVREGDFWMVDIDVGALAVKIAKVKVDARTGDILSYDIPEKGSKEAK